MESPQHSRDDDEEPEEPREYSSPACYLHEFERSVTTDSKQSNGASDGKATSTDQSTSTSAS